MGDKTHKSKGDKETFDLPKCYGYPLTICTFAQKVDGRLLGGEQTSTRIIRKTSKRGNLESA